MLEHSQAAQQGPAARRRPTAAREADSPCVERGAEGANEADGPYSAACAWSVYGLRLQADHPLPGVVGAPAAPGVDVRVWCGSRPSWVRRIPEWDRRLWYASPSRDARGRPALTMWELGRG